MNGSTYAIWVTGSNIAIVAGLLMLVGTKAVGTRRSVWIAMGGVGLYTILVGADAAVVRAAIMGGLFVLALCLSIQTDFLLFLNQFHMLLCYHRYWWKFQANPV